MTRRLISAFAQKGPSQSERARALLAVLTGRELEVIQAVARGLSNAEISRALDMAEATVKAHVSRCLAKLELTNRVQAAMLVHDAGLV